MTEDETIAEQVRQAFPPDVREAILEALHIAYRDAREQYDPSIGCDGLTFGIGVYTFACFQLMNRLDGLPGVHLLSRHPSFRLAVGGFVVGCHRLSGDEKDPICETFPPNQHAARTLCHPQQVRLPFGEPEPARAGGIVIAHLGNPEIGLGSAYLAMPESVDENNRIDSWRYTELLWSRDGGEGARGPITVTLPPAEEIQAPVIRRRPKADGA